MGVLDGILATKPLSEWQESVKQKGRFCEKCGAKANITAPISHNEEMLRISCPTCSHVSYEFPKHQAKIIKFEDLK